MKLSLPPDIDTLNASTVESFIPPQEPENQVLLSLRNIRFADPFGVIMLLLLIKNLRGHSIDVKVVPPTNPDVSNWLERMNFFVEIENDCEFTWDISRLRSNLRNPSRSLKEVTRITSEKEITSIVEVLTDILIDDYGFQPQVVYRLGGVMIETFQNIPQHSNPMKEDFDPYGIAAIQSYKDHFYLVVGDIGIGIRGSLALSGRYKRQELSDLEAIKIVLENGASRFKDEGRGGQIKRVCQIVSSLGGTTLLRSGNNRILVKGNSIKSWEGVGFPGTQIAIKIPHTALTRIKPAVTFGEPPYYAYFRHPDGSWYMLWMTFIDGKENRWNVHATYDKKGLTEPKLDGEWYRELHGEKNWKFNTKEDALDHFYQKRYLPRIKHGYILVRGNLPEELKTKSQE
ncbi:MAG TPA: hypothetical protein VHT73_09150 [Thermodesulfobacteriota bacterium]|nr:hypothetical protein [Thermodesulfobacteriota bacterium]